MWSRSLPKERVKPVALTAVRVHLNKPMLLYLAMFIAAQNKSQALHRAFILFNSSNHIFKLPSNKVGHKENSHNKFSVKK
jgi:hypothetical protein